MEEEEREGEEESAEENAPSSERRARIRILTTRVEKGSEGRRGSLVPTRHLLSPTFSREGQVRCRARRSPRPSSDMCIGHYLQRYAEALMSS